MQENLPFSYLLLGKLYFSVRKGEAKEMHQLLLRKPLPLHSHHCPYDGMSHCPKAAEPSTMVFGLVWEPRKRQSLYPYCEDSVS